MSMIHRADLNFQAMLRLLGEWGTGSHVSTEGGMLAVAGPSRFPGAPFNASMRIGKTPAHEAVSSAMSHFAEFGRGFTMYVREGIDVDVEAECQARGLIACGDMPVMALSGVSRRGRVPSELAFSPVRTVEDVRLFAELSGQAYLTHGVPAKVVSAAFSNSRAVLDSPTELILAQLHGQWIGCGLLLFDSNVAGVFWISVLPQFRRRNYATELTTKLVERAIAHGALDVVLQASPMAVDMYRKLGFREITRLRCYCQPRQRRPAVVQPVVASTHRNAGCYQAAARRCPG